MHNEILTRLRPDTYVSSIVLQTKQLQSQDNPNKPMEDMCDSVDILT